MILHMLKKYDVLILVDLKVISINLVYHVTLVDLLYV